MKNWLFRILHLWLKPPESQIMCEATLHIFRAFLWLHLSLFRDFQCRLWTSVLIPHFQFIKFEFTDFSFANYEDTFQLTLESLLIIFEHLSVDPVAQNWFSFQSSYKGSSNLKFSKKSLIHLSVHLSKASQVKTSLVRICLKVPTQPRMILGLLLLIQKSLVTFTSILVKIIN